ASTAVITSGANVPVAAARSTTFRQAAVSRLSASAARISVTTAEPGSLCRLSGAGVVGWVCAPADTGPPAAPAGAPGPAAGTAATSQRCSRSVASASSASEYSQDSL